MAKVLISMPDEFLDTVDEFASIEQRTRSELIREALRNYINVNRSIYIKTNKNLNKKEEDSEILDNLLD